MAHKVTLLVGTALAAFAASATVPATVQAADKVSDADKAFVAMVSQGGM